MDPHAFLELAATLIGGLTEAEWRTAVSRSYYACFHMTRRLLLENGFVVPMGEQAHGYIWLRLCNCSHPDIQQAGWQLKDLRSVRNQADYDLEIVWKHSEAAGWLHQALDISQILDAAAGIPEVMAQFTESIQRYEQELLKQNTWRP